MSIDKVESGNRNRKADDKVDEKVAKTMSFFEKAQANAVTRLKVSAEEDGTKIGPDHPNRDAGNLLLMKAIGVPDVDFF